ncbi:hypothetical protein QO014_002578 [Kaistia dalseonensis]|uniref:Uncharacterized protein n=1 Tax=Kaistia dalseonensis TaxID=410840 RepID=A0ABU0H7A5_9HYPH|nr:hypothetical protein [Kaistia dalseonensis]
MRSKRFGSAGTAHLWDRHVGKTDPNPVGHDVDHDVGHPAA